MIHKSIIGLYQRRVQTFVTTTNISGIKNEIIQKSDLYQIHQGQITFIEEGVLNGE